MAVSPNIQSTRIVLASRPQGLPTSENFRTEVVDLPAVADGHVLLRTVYLSLDPYMRGRMSAAKSYAPHLALGEVMVGATVGQVVESRHADLAEGDYVLAGGGWQSHAVVDGAQVRRLDSSAAPLSTALGVLGMPGFTAYSGLLKIGRPQPGETVVVAAATGPVGSAVGQIAQLKGQLQAIVMHIHREDLLATRYLRRHDRTQAYSAAAIDRDGGAEPRLQAVEHGEGLGLSAFQLDADNTALAEGVLDDRHNIIAMVDLPLPAGPISRLLVPVCSPPPTSASRPALPLESAARSKVDGCSAATRRG